MTKSITRWTCMLVLVATGIGYGMATEQIGPDSVAGHPTVAQPDWPAGIAAIPRHQSRVYSIWVNGNENFYFQAKPAEVNDLVALFSKARMRDHEIVIAAGKPDVKTFGGDAVGYNVSLQIVAGLVLFMARERERADLPLEPRLTIYAGNDRAILDRVIWPGNVIVQSEIPDLPVPTGRSKPQRNAYYGRLAFADGSPPVEFVQGVNSRITLWEQQEQEGINVASVNNEGCFTVLLSDRETADLRTGKIWLTATIANYLTKAGKTDQRVPVERLVRDKEQAEPIPIQPLGYYYGRILFEDGSPAVLDRASWRGAEIQVDFPFAGMAAMDSDGYFKVLLTKEQFEKLCADKARRNIYIPDPTRPGTSSATMTYPANLLSQDRSKAGVVKILRPRAPEKELAAAESRLGQSIPGFQNIRFEAFRTDQTKDKALLVCFWDVDQRSSRQCIQALHQRKNALQAKGLVVLAIHCGSQGQGQVSDWLRKNEISLTRGTIEDDSHDVLLAWGVRGTPWMILTDEQHTVTKEGFGLEELGPDK